MMVFSFWPDVIMIKEVGDPMAMAEYLGLDSQELQARIILAQGRQNTNYAIDIYACHPFFIQGIRHHDQWREHGLCADPGISDVAELCRAMWAISPIRRCLPISSTTRSNQLGLGLDMYKHIITPLKDEELARHPDGKWLRLFKQSCRPLIIDGPNCVIGCLPGQDPLHGPGQQEAASRCRRRRSRACSPFPPRCAVSMRPFRPGTRAGIFSP